MKRTWRTIGLMLLAILGASSVEGGPLARWLHNRRAQRSGANCRAVAAPACPTVCGNVVYQTPVDVVPIAQPSVVAPAPVVVPATYNAPVAPPVVPPAPSPDAPPPPVIDASAPPAPVPEVAVPKQAKPLSPPKPIPPVVPSSGSTTAAEVRKVAIGAQANLGRAREQASLQIAAEAKRLQQAPAPPVIADRERLTDQVKKSVVANPDELRDAISETEKVLAERIARLPAGFQHDADRVKRELVSELVVLVNREVKKRESAAAKTAMVESITQSTEVSLDSVDPNAPPTPITE